MPEASQWNPSLSREQTRNYIKSYELNPRRFDENSLNSLRQHAQYHNVPFYEGDFSISDAITQIAGGFIEGFTTFNPIKKAPDNEYEAIAKNIGHLIGFAPGILSGPLGWAGKVAGISKLKRASDALRGARGIPLQIAESVVLPRASKIAKSAINSSFVKRNDAFDTFRQFVSKGVVKDISEGAFQLGTASAISSWQAGVDVMLDSAFHGAIFGGGFRAIGNFINAGDPKAEIFARSLSGSIYQGLPSTIRGASTPEQIYEYLMGAYFGGKEKPWSYKAAAKEFKKGLDEAKKDPSSQPEATLNPEYFKNWENIPESVKPFVKQMAKDYAMQTPEQAGIGAYKLVKALGLNPEKLKIGKKPKGEEKRDFEEIVVDEVAKKAYETRLDNWLSHNPGKTEKDFLKVEGTTPWMNTLNPNMTKKEAKEAGYTEKQRIEFNEGLAENRKDFNRNFNKHIQPIINEIKKLSNEGYSWNEIKNMKKTSTSKSYGRKIDYMLELATINEKTSNNPEGAKFVKRQIRNMFNVLNTKKTPVVKPITPEQKIEQSRKDTYIITSGKEGIESLASQESNKAGLKEVKATWLGQKMGTKTKNTDEIVFTERELDAIDSNVRMAVDKINLRVDNTNFGKKIDVSKYPEAVQNSLKRDAWRIKYAQNVIVVDPLNAYMNEATGLSRVPTEMAINQKKKVFVFDKKYGWHKYSYNQEKFVPTATIPELARRTAFFGAENPTKVEIGQIQKVFEKHASEGFKDEITAKAQRTQENDTSESLEYDIAELTQSAMDFRLSSIMQRNLDKSLKESIPDAMERYDFIAKAADKAGKLVVNNNYLKKGRESKSREWIDAIEENIFPEPKKGEKRQQLPNELKRELRRWLVQQNQSFPIFSGSYLDGVTDVIYPESPFTKSGMFRKQEGPTRAIEEVYLKANPKHQLGREPILVSFTDVSYKLKDGTIRDVELSRLEQVITKNIASNYDKYKDAVKVAKLQKKLIMQNIIKDMEKKFKMHPLGGEGDKDKVTFVKYHPNLNKVKLPKLPEESYKFAEDTFGISRAQRDKMTKSIIKYTEDLNNGRPIKDIAGKDGFIKNTIDDNKRSPLWLSSGWRGDKSFWTDIRNHGQNLNLDANGNLKATFVKDPAKVKDITNLINTELPQHVDGGIIVNTPTGKVARADKGVPDSGQEKSILVVPSKNGTKLLKYMLHETTPELSKMMENYIDPATKEKGLNMIAYSSAGKQIGDFPVGNYEIINNKLVLTEGAKIFKVSPEDFRYNYGVYDSHHSIGKNDGGKVVGQSFPKQALMGPHKDIRNGSQEVVNDLTETLSGQSFKGSLEANKKVSEYISTKNNKLIEDIMSDFDNIGIKEIETILKEKGAEPLAQRVLLEIVKTNKSNIESLRNEGELTGSEASNEIKSIIDFHGTADNIIQHAAALKDPSISLMYDKYTRPYIEKALDKFIAERVAKPKVKNSLKGRLRIYDKGLQKEFPELNNDKLALKKHGVKADELFFLDNMFKETPIYANISEFPKLNNTTLGEFWKVYQSNKVQSSKELKNQFIEVLEAANIRVPVDALSGVQVLRLGGFTGVKGHGIMVHSRAMEKLGGADLDADAAFVFFGGRNPDGSGQGMKRKWIEMYRNQNDEFLDDKGKFVDVKERYKEAVVLDAKKLADRGINPKVFDWSHNKDNKYPYMQFTPDMRMFQGQETAKNRNTMGPVVSMTQNMRAAWSSVRQSPEQAEIIETGTITKKKVGKKYIDLPENKQTQFRVKRTALEPNNDQIWLTSALTRYTADPANELGLIEYPQMKRLLERYYFEKPVVEIRDKKGNWVESKTPFWKNFFELQGHVKRRFAPDHVKESRYDLIDGINRAFYGYDYNLNRSFSYEQKQEMVSNLDKLSDAELSTALPKIGTMLKDVDTRMSIYDKINEKSYLEMMNKQKIIGKTLSKTTDYKQLLDRTVLYRPQSKYVDFVFNKNFNNPFVRKNYSENIESFLSDISKVGIKNDGKLFPKITIEDTPSEALRKMNVLFNTQKDFLSNSVDEIASLNSIIDRYTEGFKRNEKVSKKEMKLISQEAEAIKALSAAQYKKRNLSILDSDVDSKWLLRLDKSQREIAKIFFPDVFKAKPTKLLDQTRLDKRISEFKAELSSNTARDIFDLRLLGSLRSKETVDKINEYLKKPYSEKQSHLFRRIIKELFQSGTKSSTTKVAYDSKAVDSKNILKFLSAKNELFKSMEKEIPKNTDKVLNALENSKEFKAISGDVDIRVRGSVIEDINGYEAIKDGRLNREQTKVILETATWLQNEPDFKKQRLNETIMGIYQKINPENLSKTLDQMTIADFKLVNNYFRQIKQGNMHQRLEEAVNKIKDASLKARNQMQFPKMVNQEMMKHDIVFLPTQGFFKTKDGSPGKFTTVYKPTYYGEVLQNWIARSQSLADGKIAELSNKFVKDLQFLDQVEAQKIDPLSLYKVAMSRYELQTRDRKDLIKEGKPDVYQERWDFESKEANWSKLQNKIFNIDFGDGKGRRAVTGMDIIDIIQKRHNEAYELYSEIQTGKKGALEKYRIPGADWLGDKTQPRLDWKKFRRDLIDDYVNNRSINIDIGADGMRHMLKSFVAETMPVTEYRRRFIDKKTGEFFTKNISIKQFKNLAKSEQKKWTADRDINFKKLEKVKIFNTGHRKGYFPHYFSSTSGLKESYKKEIDNLNSRFKNGNITEENYVKEAADIFTKFQRRSGDLDMSHQEMMDVMDSALFPEVNKFLSKKEMKLRDMSNAIHINQRIGTQNKRENHLGGWIIDPLVNATYVTNTVNNFYKQVSNFMTRATLHDMKNHMERKWVIKAKKEKDKKEGRELVDNWLTFWHQYVREAQGAPNVVTSRMWNNPKLFYSNTPAGWFADNIVSNQVNKVMDKLGLTDADIPEGLRGTKAINMQEWSRLEAKFQLATLMTHPKTPINNIFGGTMHTYQSVGGAALKKARDYKYLQTINPKLKTSKDVYEMMDRHGIQTELLKHEYGFDKNFQTGKNKAFIEDLSKNLKSGKEITKQELQNAARKHGVGKKIMDIAGKYMSIPERMLRKDAFMAHYIKAWERFGGSIENPEHPFLIEIGKKGVKATQFLYDAAHRPAFGRSGLGKVFSRFQLWAWNAVRFRNDIRKQASIYDYKPNTEAMRKFERLMTADMFILALGSVFMYSMFGQIIPAPYNWLQDTAEWVFGDEDERNRAFFGMYPGKLAPLQMITPPIARFPISIIREFAEDDYTKLSDYYAYTMFPFGRQIRDFVHPDNNLIENPMRAPEKLLGIPLTGLAKEAKRRKTSDYKPPAPGGSIFSD